jgi:hypothetical protein
MARQVAHSGGAGSIGADRFVGEGHFRLLLKCGEINHETDERDEKKTVENYRSGWVLRRFVVFSPRA